MIDTDELAGPPGGDAAATAADFDADTHADPDEPSPRFETDALRQRPWRVAKSLLKLRDQVDAFAPRRGKKSDGTIGDAAHAKTDSDHNPWVIDGDMGVVTAIDLTHDPAGGFDAGRLAEAIHHSRDRRVKYVIWNRRIVSSTVQPWVWRPYRGSNPHTTHVHLSVRPEKRCYDDVSPWPVGAPGKDGTLELGDRGPDVAELQKELAKALKRALATDGVFGPATREAVMDFQRRAKLEVDGIAGPKTRAALSEATS